MDRLVAAGLALAALLAADVAAAAPPRLVKQGTASQLVVDGHPMLLIAGELGNSSASSAAYMAPHWSRLKAMGLNTVLAPVSWELIEPAPGRFDWTSVDALIQSARANDLKLVLLWFGAWKNSMSTYAPSWVKRDQARFPLAQLPNGQGVQTLSTFGAATLQADERAFSALLAHLKAIDSEKSTVVMVQVENEMGMLPVAREHGPAADAAFAEPVPQALVDYLIAHHATLEPQLRMLWEAQGAPTKGDWRTLFGQGDAAAEVFTAWRYARWAQALAAAGKAQYPIPLYVNAAQNRAGKAPGEYPSGGPLPHLLDVWKAAAPSLDLLAPDIYFPSFVDLAGRYRRAYNPLFVPEANNADRPEVPANAYYAFGELDAIGFGPFSIESVDQAEPRPELADAYAVLGQLEPAILAAQGTGRMAGFKPRVLEDGTVKDEPVTRRIGDWRFTVSFVDTQSPKADQNTAAHGGLIIQTGPEDFLVAGAGIIVTVEPVGPGPPQAGFDSVWEGRFDPQGGWIPGRRLNGDQTHQGRHLRLAPGQHQIQKVRLYRYR
jgi:beta-galactosidase GanA